MKPNKEDLKYIKAKTKVDQNKSFFRNIIFFLFVSAFLMTILLIMKAMGADSAAMTFMKFIASTTCYIWGFVIVLHAAAIFGSRLLFGEHWEAKQIEKYMNEDQNETN